MTTAGLRVGAIEYLVDRESIHAVWHDADGVSHRLVVGATRRFLDLVDALREELRSTMAVARGKVPRLREFAAGWGRELLPEGAVDADVLVVVPHAFLHDVPLHLVQVQGEELGARVGISYASSRSLFVRCAGRNPARAAPARPRWFVGGGADVQTGDNGPFRGLAGSIADLFEPDDVLQFRGEEPYSRAAVKAAFRRDEVDVLCVVAHGYTDPVNHRMSGLMVELDTFGIMSRAIPLHGGRYFDFRDLPLRRFPAAVLTASRAEILTAAELEVDGHLDAQLVVLLACSTGWGRVLDGDEPASLAESFLHIGAPSVLAPMWDSDYEPTREWAHRFFEAWVKDGKPKALAARHATRELRNGPWADRPERLGAMALRGDWL